MKMFDTIAAIATPLGSGGVAIIRVSGADSEKVSQNVVKTKSGKNTLHPSKRMCFRLRPALQSPGLKYQYSVPEFSEASSR